jgi:DNA polymerase I
MENKKVIYLIDAYALIYRAYYAFIKSPRFNSKGLNTSAILGFMNSMLEIIEKQKPDYLGVVFDPAGKNFRHELYEPYKANRQQTPEDIKVSVPIIKQILDGLHICRVEQSGFEADDVIGSLAFRASDKGFNTFMVTPDKDYLQLISDNRFILKPKRGSNESEIIGLENLENEFGVKFPQEVIEVLALWGDASDNVPGARGIGEKGAKKLIEQFGSVENVFANIDRISGKTHDCLINSKENVFLSKQLVTINTNIPVAFNESEFKIEELNFLNIKEILEELDFKGFLNKYIKTEKHSITNKPAVQMSLFDTPAENVVPEKPVLISREVEYKITSAIDERLKIMDSCIASANVGIYIITSGVDAVSLTVLGLALSFEPTKAYYLSFSEEPVFIEKLRLLFGNTEQTIVGQNLKQSIHAFNNHNISIKAKLFDITLADYLLQPELQHSLDAVANRYLHVNLQSPLDKHLSAFEKGLSIFNTVPEESMLFACEQADISLLLKDVLEKELEKSKLSLLFKDMETPMIDVLAGMERVGIKLNIEELAAYKTVLKKRLDILEQDIYELAGTKFNILSPKQLGVVLFETLKIDPDAKKTKTEQYQTGEEILVKLQQKHPIVNKILEYRGLNKLISTYIESLPQLVNPNTNHIHCSFNQFVTATGRLSSSNPNLQNIPIRDDDGREIRKALVASSDKHTLVSADYSQIELRIMAHLSQDKAMMSAFDQGADIHSLTAARVYKVDLSAVTKEMRRRAKVVNFGIIYGISTFGLAERLNISRAESKELIDGYFISFPAVKEYMDFAIKIAREKGFAETIFGRRRYLADINSKNHVVRSFAERNAINAPIQGSAADIVKKAMIDINNSLKTEAFKSELIIQVHDELVFNVLKEEAERLKELIKEKMETVVKLRVPLIVDIGEGLNWLEAH